MSIINMVLFFFAILPFSTAFPFYNGRIGGLIPANENQLQRRRPITHPSNPTAVYHRDEVLVLFNKSIDLSGNNFAPREVLLSTTSGMTLTCVDCAMQGQMGLSINIGLNQTALDAFISAATGLEGAATSAVASVFASETSTLIPEITSVLGTATAIAASEISKITAEIVSVVTDGIPSAASVVASDVTSSAAAVTSGLLGHLKRQSVTQDLEALLLDAVDASVEITQSVPIETAFNIEVATGDQAISVPLFAFPQLPGMSSLSEVSTLSSLLAGKAADGFTLGPFNITLQVQPLMMKVAAILTPHLNVTFPLTANLTLNQTLAIGTQTGISGSIPAPLIAIEEPTVSSFNPALSLVLTIGAALVFEVGHAASNTSISFVTELEFPKLNVTLAEVQNVNSECQSGNITNGVLINAAFDVGFVLEGSIASALGLSNIPKLGERFELEQTCFDPNAL